MGQQMHSAFHEKTTARTESQLVGSLLLAATGTEHILDLEFSSWLLDLQSFFGSCCSRQPGLYCLSGLRADKCIYELTIFEDQHGGDAANTEAA
jgi:hypothetical protein